jgi:uncharacterized protein involved in exopolysaccharide biosynthesis
VFSPTTYTAEISLLPTTRLESRGSDVLVDLAAFKSGAAISRGINTRTFDPTQWLKGLLVNQELVSRILEQEYPLVRGQSRKLVDLLNVRSGNREETLERATRAINRGALEAKLSLMDGTTTISVTLSDPVAAAALANDLPLQMEQQLRLISKPHSSQQLEFLGARLQEVGSELTRSEERLRDFRERNRSDALAPQLRKDLVQLVRDLGTNEATFRELKSRYEVARIEAAGDVPQLVVIEKATPPIEPSSHSWVAIMASALLISVAAWAALFVLLRIGHRLGSEISTSS